MLAPGAPGLMLASAPAAAPKLGKASCRTRLRNGGRPWRHRVGDAVIEAVRSPQHQVRAGKAARIHGVLDYPSSGAGRQASHDTRGQPPVDADLVSATDIDARVMGRGLEIHAEIDDEARQLQHRAKDSPATGSADAEPRPAVARSDNRAHIG